MCNLMLQVGIKGAPLDDEGLRLDKEEQIEKGRIEFKYSIKPPLDILILCS